VAKDLMYLADSVQKLLESEPTITQALAPCKVFGDIHGHFRDLLLLLHDFGFPTGHGPTYIFNGDWVDRGKHQLEVVCLLFALKLAYPEQIVLNRGNHEDSAQNSHMGSTGFLDKCNAQLASCSDAVYTKISETFEWLPLGCVISDKILVVHGGIGDGNWLVDEVQETPRPLSHDALASQPVLYNMLWSDPLAEDGCNGFGVHDSPRDNHANLVHSFGQDVTEHFLSFNGLDMVIRSHEARPQGCGYEVMHSGKCIRVFSARDYEGMKNDGSILSVTQDQNALVVRPQVLRSLTK
jgi:diadenosine tetraphosphatase ApaH/serine/threonine PP2A family protein phosphatase